MKDIFSAKSSHVKRDPKSNVCLLQQPASKQDISTQYQGEAAGLCISKCITASGCILGCTTEAGKTAIGCRAQRTTESREKQRCNPRECIQVGW